MSQSLKKLENDVIAAMKAGDRSRLDVLRMLVNKVKMIAKNDKNRLPTDEDVITAGLKTIKEANETRDIYIAKGVDASVQDNEIKIVSEYLPKQMSEDELRTLIVELSSNAPEGKSAKGYYMKELNGRFKGEFDNKIAQQIISELM